MEIIADDEYPEKVAFIIINEMFNEFYQLMQLDEIDKIHCNIY